MSQAKFTASERGYALIVQIQKVILTAEAMERIV